AGAPARGAPPLDARAPAGARDRRAPARPPEAPCHRLRRARVPDTDRVRAAPPARGERRPAADAPDDPPARLGPGVQPRIELPPRLRIAPAPEDRARPGPAELHPHRAGRRLQARRAVL